MGERKIGLKMFVGFLASAAVGAGLALLFAPQSGKRTRKKIKDFSDKVVPGRPVRVKNGKKNQRRKIHV
jgi:gas vesicle protein